MTTRYVPRNHDTPRTSAAVASFYSLLKQAPEEIYREFWLKPATPANCQRLYNAIYGHNQAPEPEPECTCSPDGRFTCPACVDRAHNSTIPY